VEKLAVSRADSDVAGRTRRHLLIPLTHGSRFRRTVDQSSLRLKDLSRSPLGYPFTLMYHEEAEYSNLQDDLLPHKCLLRADGIVDEDSLVVARISEDDALTATRCGGGGVSSAAATVIAEDAFHLPLRTKLTVCLGEMLRRPVRCVLSYRNDFAEELSKITYNQLVGHVEVGYVLPQIRPAIGSFCFCACSINNFLRIKIKNRKYTCIAH